LENGINLNNAEELRPYITENLLHFLYKEIGQYFLWK